MSVIIRLQGLPWSASTLDIRNFFRNLTIPQGGVHIIGGERGDAFIAFSSDEDARQAMMRNSAALNDVPVQLFLSSKSEMQTVIDEARNRDSHSMTKAPAPMPKASGPVSGMRQNYPNQQQHSGPHNMGHQQPPQHSDYRQPYDSSHGQFPPVQGQMANRNNQSSFDSRGQDPFQQNAPGNTQGSGRDGQQWNQSYERFPSNRNNQDNQNNQWNSGSYDPAMEGGYGGNDGNQWHKEGSHRGNKQSFYDSDYPSQDFGQGPQRDQPSDQYGQSDAGWNAPPQNQRREPNRPDNWQGSMQRDNTYNNRDQYGAMQDQSGPQDANMRVNSQYPPEQNRGPGPAPGEQMPHHTRHDDNRQFPSSARPNTEPWHDANTRQGGSGRFAEEPYTPQGRDGNQFPPNQQQYGRNDNFYGAEPMGQDQWSGYGGDESGGYDQARGPGQSIGRNQASEDASTFRDRIQDAPEKDRPRTRTRKSRFDQPDEKTLERDSDRKSLGRNPEETPSRMGLDDRPGNRNYDERPGNRGSDSRSFEGDFSGRLIDDPNSNRSVRRGRNEPPRERNRNETQGTRDRSEPARERDRNERPHERDRSWERDWDGGQFKRERDGQPSRRERDDWNRGRDGDRNQGRTMEEKPERRAFDRGSGGSQMARDQERMPFEGGPDKRGKEGGLLGRAPGSRPPFQGGQDTASGEEQRDNMPPHGTPFDSAHGRGDMPPDGRGGMPPDGPPGRGHVPPHGIPFDGPHGRGQMPPDGRGQMPLDGPHGRGQMPPDGPHDRGQMPPYGRGQMPPDGPHGRGQMPPDGRGQMPTDGPRGRGQMAPDGRGQMPPDGPHGRGQMPPDGRGQMPPDGPHGRGQMPPDGPRGRGQMPPDGREQMPSHGPHGRGQIPPDGAHGRGQMPPDGRGGIPPDGRGQMPPDGPDGRGQMPPDGPDGRGQMPPDGRQMPPDGPHGRGQMPPDGRGQMPPDGRGGMPPDGPHGREQIPPDGREQMPPDGPHGRGQMPPDGPHGGEQIPPDGRGQMRSEGPHGRGEMTPRGRGGMPPSGLLGRGGMPPDGAHGRGQMPPDGPHGRGEMLPHGRGEMPPHGRGGIPPHGRGGIPPGGPRGRGGMPSRGRGGMLPGGPHGRGEMPAGNRFQSDEHYEDMGMDYHPQGQGEQGMGKFQDEQFPGENFDSRGRGRGDNRGRGRIRGNEGYRGGRGFDRGSFRGRGRGRGFNDFEKQDDRGFNQFPDNEGFNEGHVEPMEMDGGQNFGNNMPYEQSGGRDVEARYRGRGGPLHGRGRGRSEFGDGQDMQRRQMGQGDFGNQRGDRPREFNDGEARSTGKGLLGDAPPGILPIPPQGAVQEEPQSAQYKNDDYERDRDRRSHREKESNRDDRSSRRSDYHQNRDRSPNRDRRHRSERDRDHSERRDRSSHRDRERGSDSKDTGSRSSDRRSNKSTDQKSSSTNCSQQSQGKYMHGKGFPVGYSNKDVQQFFSSCDLLTTGIKIMQNAQGKNTGEVYLQFSTDQAAKKAFLKNGEKILGNAITLTFTTKQTFDEKSVPKPSSAGTEKDKSTSLPAEAGQKNNRIVMIKGLPLNIKREDLVNFFSSVKLAPTEKSLVLECNEKNQATGIAFIVTSSQKDFETAMSFHGRLFGSKPLDLLAGQQKDLDACIAKQEELKKKGEVQKTAQDPQPPSGAGLMGARPPLMGLAPGIPGPQSPFNMKPPMGPRNGPLLETPLLQQPNERPTLLQQPNERPTNFIPGFCVQIQGLSMGATYEDIREFFCDLNIVTHRGIHIVHDAIGKPTGEGFVEFVTQEDKDKALKKDKTSLGRQIVAVKSVSKSDMIERLRKARLSGMPSDEEHHQPQPRMPEAFVTLPPGLLNPRWFYVNCENFPHGISVPQILRFFQGFNPIPESVRQLYADDGTATGNAIVGFCRREDANYALNELNGMLCRKSIVILHPVRRGPPE